MPRTGSLDEIGKEKYRQIFLAAFFLKALINSFLLVFPCELIVKIFQARYLSR